MKAWYKSKTMLFNLIMAFLVGLQGAIGIIQPYLPVNFYAFISIALPIVNIVLRAISSTGISFDKGAT